MRTRPRWLSLAWLATGLAAATIEGIAAAPYVHAATEIGRIPTLESGNVISLDLACNPIDSGFTTFDVEGDVVHVHCNPLVSGKGTITCALVRQGDYSKFLC